MLSKLIYPIRGFCTSVQLPRPWLFVGLGNPGDKFKGTRHNVGFNMIDTFAESQGIAMDTVFCKAIFGKGIVDGVPVLLAKPQTYMNLSGESSGPLAAYYKLPLNQVVVDYWFLTVPNLHHWHFEVPSFELVSGIWQSQVARFWHLLDPCHDDMDLPCGVLRLQPNGGHRSHNGLKSVIQHFRGNRGFARLRIGIGTPPGQMDPKAFLLQKFNATARERINAGLKEGAVALKEVLTKGVEESGRIFNTEQKYKHIKVADNADTRFTRSG